MATKNFDFRWLLGNEAAPLLKDVQLKLERGDDILRIVSNLRKEISPEQSALVVELAQLRTRAGRKFNNARNMFFTRRALEMATDQQIATFKSQRFDNMHRIADVCCGVGGDLISLAKLDQTEVAGIDSDELSVAYANANLEAHGLAAVASVGQFESAELSNFDAVHIDPERRAPGKAVRGEKFSPPLPDILGLPGSANALAIKIAPATRCPELDTEQFELEWIGHSRECKQQVIWLGDLARGAGMRTATVLTAAGSHGFTSVGDAERQVATNEKLCRYLYEPHSVVLAADLVDDLARERSLVRISTGNVYLTGDELVSSPLLAAFEIIETTTGGISKVADVLKRLDVGKLEVKKRGLPDHIVDNYKRLKLKGSESATILLTRRGDQRLSVIARRVVAANAD